MDILDLLEIVNTELKQGKPLTKIAKDNFGVNESTIRKRLNKEGYKRVGNKFVLQPTEEDEGQEVGQSVGHQEKPVIINVGHQKDSVGHYKKEFNSLMENYDILIEIIEQYKNNNNYTPGGIEVRLPVEENGQFKASLRINKTVLDDFKKFCNDNKQFTQKELLSMALIEYMERYKK